MGDIRVLSTVLINQIAAGEVIVRPASVVKELVENSIDAGATRIRVEVDRTCRNITVTDNGRGMSPEDAELAPQRHATSKIRDLSDLRHITTRGFRGEALASIAAVSRMELLTRPPDAVAGFRLAIEGGREESKGPVGCAVGSTIRVRDLFFNTPARRKFLKSDHSEFNAIMQLLTRQMLARGEIGFAIIRDGKKIIELPTDQPLGPRMAHLLGNLDENALLKVNADRHGVRVYGYVSRPEATRKDRREQYFFVNGRPVSHRSMGFALEQAYHGLLMNGRHAVCCLFIDVPPEEVDVNVHPTKEEVRFRDEARVTGVLNRAVAETLRAANLTPLLDLAPGAQASRGQAAAAGPTATGDGAAPPSRSYAETQLPLSVDARPLPEGLPAPERPPASGAPKDAVIPPFDLPRRAAPSAATRAAPVSAPAPAGNAAASPSDSTMTPEVRRPTRDALTPPTILGQVGDSYVVAAIGDDLLIVDQHAAHERLNFNRVMALLSRGGADTQPLLMPVTFDLSSNDVGRFEEYAPLLRRIGIEIEPFGGRTHVVRSLPAALPELDVVAAIQDLVAEQGEEGGLRSATPQETLAARIACHASIKAHQRLSDGEARVLIEDLLAADDQFTCPHGRPTMMRLTLDELDRKFRRK